ncbi:tRNA (adenosine(37)-N6)-threonylcarbamoyltransferase complex dimerization subunit type 1 TsaB [Bacteroidales bacterium OttesenSCG-928-B11]|nr:tRNA (adenosine(37)-N6)-threonylcarbamoyltransferase complex dimerization subunit type 1 TsaB [Bacteroidales bacterium OttesenSCG-928-B11]
MNHQNITLLYIETATETCSVALSINDQIVISKEIANGFSHAENLIPFIDEIMMESKTIKEQLSAIVLSIGPGSYTGLRIGASTAKGLAYALDIPVIAIPTLQSIMMGAKKEIESAGNLTGEEMAKICYCPMIDARRMEVFTTLFSADGSMLQDISAMIIDENSFAELLEKRKVVFCGNGMPKCKDILSRYPNAIFSNAPLSSTNMLEKALEKFKNQEFEDKAYFEPFYLKEYIAVKSGVKGLK